ncbi:MAG TPA: SPFH domain-containing protein [Candidatus Eisenbacteria bacterium]|jgi:regulator of protease activity HflC (stomatin/prohibitin superfamily)
MTREKVVTPLPGAMGLLVGLLFSAAAIYVFVQAVVREEPIRLLTLVLPSVLVAVLSFVGLFTVQPNQGVVLILFGSYVGSTKASGWWWTNPFNIRKKISLRARNLNGQVIKVNDNHGNPVEIAAVVVWRVRDTAQAVFDVDDYERYVTVQSETAVRHLASQHPYDEYETDAISLRGSTDKVSEFLRQELTERLKQAGVEVQEARLSHLAYAPEIAAAMLQRQQAAAIIAARQRIVDGAVGMVEMALQRLNQSSVVDLDEERKAAMVSNLLVVLCGDHSATPVVNAGTLHTG